MRLTDFILANLDLILAEWERFAGSLAPGARMDALALRDHAEAILRACVRDMGATQSRAQQTNKSEGQGGAGGAASDALDDASAVHGVGRVGSGFNLNEVVAEYRALRATVLRLWRENASAPNLDHFDDATRFNEAIDQSLAQAVAGYTRRIDQSRRMFLAILGHDLRNPLNSISLSAQLAAAQHAGDSTSSQALFQIETSVEAIARLVQDLLDFATTGLGGQMPLALVPVNLEALCREVLAELKAAHPGRMLTFETRGGDVTCVCDGARMRQVLSNLLGNALQHGAESSQVELLIASEEAEMTLAVRNQGTPIPPEVLPTIFDPLVRGMAVETTHERRAGSIGLGLYIAHEIVTSHGGTIEIDSSTESGTVFTVRIPRRRSKR